MTYYNIHEPISVKGEEILTDTSLAPRPSADRFRYLTRGRVRVNPPSPHEILEVIHTGVVWVWERD